MATLTVWKFPAVEAADQALNKLTDLAKQQLITIEDAAIITWPEGKKKPKTRQVSLTAPGAMHGAFWGMLFGLIFFVPLFGMAVGAAMGALAGRFADYGINDNFIKEVREKVTPGTSALFLLTRDAVTDRVADAFKDTQMDLIQSNLTKEQEDQLREAFGEEE